MSLVLTLLKVLTLHLTRAVMLLPKFPMPIPDPIPYPL